MESTEISTPATCVKFGASEIAKRPEPQYVSTRWVGRGEVEAVVLKMASRTYETSEGRTELLFWKNDPAGNSNEVEPTVSRTVALWSVMQMCSSSDVDVSSVTTPGIASAGWTTVVEDDAGCVSSIGGESTVPEAVAEGATVVESGRRNESRKSKVAPRLYESIFLRHEGKQELSVIIRTSHDGAHF